MEDEELGTTFVSATTHQLSYSTDLFTYWLIDRFILSFMVVMLEGLNGVVAFTVIG